MRHVPKHYLGNVFNLSEEKNRVQKIVEHMQDMHISMGDTPRRYVEFIKQYQRIVNEKRNAQLEQKHFLRVRMGSCFIFHLHPAEAYPECGWILNK